MIQRSPTRSRIPTAGLREMNSSNTNARSGIAPPGFIANKQPGLGRMTITISSHSRTLADDIRIHAHEEHHPGRHHSTIGRNSYDFSDRNDL